MTPLSLEEIKMLLLTEEQFSRERALNERLGVLQFFPEIACKAKYRQPTWPSKMKKWNDYQRKVYLFSRALGGDGEGLFDTVSMLAHSWSRGCTIKLTHRNIDLAMVLFGEWVVEQVRKAGIHNPVFVAMPNRDALPGNDQFRNALIARLAADLFGERASAYDGLRFKTLVPRDARVHLSRSWDLRDNMALTKPLPAGTLILLDDVYSLGDHTTAAWQALPDNRRPRLALFGAQTASNPREWTAGEQEWTHQLCW